ncbi:F-box/LRR-repeat protein 12 isoform X2 [Harpia harpyja]|uniref:F-box/LRR-repeat protein 12 isoform X2 n=1 Tax=Harpia harpyja TaxID=202280 RepID=UPI0022B2132B|nr:F-box/LRR-repeat protein 12 isoform X2 [Harpia harpyja]
MAAAANSELPVLPDSVLLQVLALLPLRERLRAARVCRRWQRLAMDRAVWRHVDLSPHRLPDPVAPGPAASPRQPADAAGTGRAPLRQQEADPLPGTAGRPREAVSPAPPAVPDRDGPPPYSLRERPPFPYGAGAESLRNPCCLVLRLRREGPAPAAASRYPQCPCLFRLSSAECLLPEQPEDSEPLWHLPRNRYGDSESGSAPGGAGTPRAASLRHRQLRCGLHRAPHETSPVSGDQRHLLPDERGSGLFSKPAAPGDTLP